MNINTIRGRIRRLAEKKKQEALKGGASEKEAEEVYSLWTEKEWESVYKEYHMEKRRLRVVNSLPSWFHAFVFHPAAQMHDIDLLWAQYPKMPGAIFSGGTLVNGDEIERGRAKIQSLTDRKQALMEAGAYLKKYHILAFRDAFSSTLLEFRGRPPVPVPTGWDGDVYPTPKQGGWAVLELPEPWFNDITGAYVENGVEYYKNYAPSIPFPEDELSKASGTRLLLFRLTIGEVTKGERRFNEF